MVDDRAASLPPGIPLATEPVLVDRRRTTAPLSLPQPSIRMAVTPESLLLLPPMPAAQGAVLAVLPITNVRSVSVSPFRIQPRMTWESGDGTKLVLTGNGSRLARLADAYRTATHEPGRTLRNPLSRMVAAMGLIPLLGVTLLAALLILAALNPVRDSATEELTRGTTLAPSDLRTGDCFSVPSPDETLVTSVDAKPCAQQHDAEVFAVFDLQTSASEFPGDDTVTVLSEEQCLARFAEDHGQPLPEDLTIYFFQPTASTWATGDREIICSAITLNGEPLQGPLTDYLPAA